MRQSLYSILEQASKKARQEDRIEVLRKNDSLELRMVVALALNPTIKWVLPSEDPQYNPNEFPYDQEHNLYNLVRKLHMFLAPCKLYPGMYNPDLTPQKRQQLFVQMLEAVDRDDAKLLLAASRKKLPFKISPDCMNKCWPGIITWNYAENQ